jgi:predicted RND superfamily exporter protein
MRETLVTSGKAILFVSTAIAGGYAVLVTSSFPLWRQLGLYVAQMMAVSALATVTILPAMVLVGRPKFLRRRDAVGEPVAVVMAATADDRPAP